VRSTLADASFDLAGPLTIGEETKAALRVDARAVDVHSIDAKAPTSRLDAAGEATFARHADGSMDATAGIDFAGGPIGPRRAPAARVDATLARAAEGALRGDVTVVSRDPALPAKVTVRAVPKGGAFSLSFDATAQARRLDGIAWLGPIARGNAKVTAHGTVDLDRRTLSARAEASGDGLERDGSHLDHASLVADIHGPMLTPAIDAELDADGATVSGIHAETVRLATRGPLSRSHAILEVAGGQFPEVRVEGDVSIGRVTSVRAIELQVAHGGPRLHVQVDEVTVGHGELRVQGANIEGLGAPARLSMTLSPDSVRIVADGRRLNLRRVGRLAHAEETLRGGHLAFDADVAIDRRGASGHVSLDLEDGAIGGLDGVGANLDAQLEGRGVTGALRAALGDAGSVEVTTEHLEIGGTGPILQSWRRAWGRANVDGHVDLAKVAAMLPAGKLPGDATGDVTVHGRVWRSSMQDETLGVRLTASTSRLVISGKPASQGAAPPWTLQGIDARLDLRADGESGFTELDARLDDAHGQLARLDLKADAIPFGKVVGAPDVRDAALRAIAFNAQVVVPERSIDDLPDLVQPDGTSGKVEAKIDVHGPLDHLSFDGRVEASKLRTAASELSTALDLEAVTHYDGARATTQLVATARKKQIVEAAVVVDAPIADVLAAHGVDFPWTASAKAHVTSFPLQNLTTLDDRQVKGNLTGDVVIDDLHHDARGRAVFEVKSLEVGDVAFPEATMTASIDDKELDVVTQIAQTDRGSLGASAHVGASWGDALVPTLDPKSPLVLTVKADRFRAAAFLPLFGGALTELDGQVKADAKATLDPRDRTAHLAGVVKLTDGRFELASVGGEMRDATATLTFTPDGVITLSDAHAAGMSGRISAAATARLDSRGLYGANATIVVPKASALLLSVSGAQVGTVDGNVGVKVARVDERHELDVDVSIPTLHVQLPFQSTRDVQQLGPIAGVRIGHQTAAGGGFTTVDLDPEKAAPVTRAEGALAVVVTIELGHDVTVKRGGTLSATLEGKPVITVTDTIRYSGQIQIVTGTLDVQGKQFEVEKGVVTFVGGDGTNPQVVLTASWTAEDGTKVYAEFVGPLKTGKVTLRSEPALSQSQILSLLLFGTVDNSQATSNDAQGDSAIRAAGAAGGAATQPLNQALDQFGLGGVQTRIDTSTTNPRPEVEIPIARDISVQLAVVLGQPPIGTNQDKTYLTVDWRFARAWSMATTVGDAETTIVDLLWHYRY
jgi:translocation and assembly module TamB